MVWYTITRVCATNDSFNVSQKSNEGPLTNIDNRKREEKEWSCRLRGDWFPMRQVQYSRPREQTIQYILSYRCAQPIRNLMQISINITLRTGKSRYLLPMH